MTKHMNLDELSINTIRFLSVDAVQKANSGHPGMPMGAAAMAYVLWTRFMKYNPANPDWFDRDRFILSAGHGSMLLYSLLHLTGYDLSLDDIKQFRQWGSITPGHPERIHTPGVEVTTGPLGQGFANGVGMAVAEAHLAARFNRPGHDIVDHHTYAIVSDGDIMEGVAAEAASLAGHLGLGKLIYLYDANQITLSAAAGLSLTEDVAKRFEAYGWQTQTLDDGNDTTAIASALDTAREDTKHPSLIIVRTHIGFGSPNKQDTFAAHGSPLGDDEVAATKKNLGWPLEPTFHIPDEVRVHLGEAKARGSSEENTWNVRFEAYKKDHPELAEELSATIAGRLPSKWAADLPAFTPDDGKIATRVASGKALNAYGKQVRRLVGGSADLNPSTHTVLDDAGSFEPAERTQEDRQGAVDGGWDFAARNLYFGVREHAMGSIANGIAAHGGLLPYTATFLIFSDYMRPTIRLAALMKLPVKFVFTHDSIALGEDGPTHQSVEQIASLRAIPGLIVLRPADANETTIAWEIAIEQSDRPVALVLTRQKLPVLDRTALAPAENVRKGAYILRDSGKGTPDLILIATGSEVPLALEAQEQLAKDKLNVRVVSMPSWELFEEQSDDYRESVLPRNVGERLAIEAAAPLGWHRWVGSDGDVIGVNRFGASAPGDRVLKEYGFNVDNVCKRARALLDTKATA